jgi:hypothetical protein
VTGGGAAPSSGEIGRGRLHTIYGNCTESDGVIRLEAARDAPDGIGCALCFMEWDGSLLRLEVDRVERWRSEPWADLWFVAREHDWPLDNLQTSLCSGSFVHWLYPLRYVRFTSDVWEMGEVLGGKKEDQRIHVTDKWADMRPGSQSHYHVSWEDGALHIGTVWWSHTRSLTAPVCELGLYVEGCVCEIRLTPA